MPATLHARRLLVALLAGAALALPARAAAPAPAPAGAPAAAPAAAWGPTRWGMTPEEVLAALPGKAFRLDPEVRLEDGNTVTVGVDGHAMDGLTFRVRFVFEKGRLALVSLRTAPTDYADPEAYDRVRKALVARWGEPLETTADKAFIDLRQTRWNLPGGRADLKYIPGVVAIVHYPRPAP